MLQSTQMLKSIWTPAFRPVMGDPPMRGGGLLNAILKLFANGEQGALYYFTPDFAGLYQDAAGTTPVTAVGQPVGLMLDRRFGLARGDELRGDGTINTAGTVPTAEYDEGDGEVFRGAGIAHQSVVIFPVEIGTFYEASFSVAAGSGALAFRFGVGGGPIISTVTAGNSVSVFFLATDATVSLCASSNNTSAEFSGFSLRQVPGNHASQPTTTARPLLQRDANGKLYLDFDGVDDHLVAASPYIRDADSDWTFGSAEVHPSETLPTFGGISGNVFVQSGVGNNHSRISLRTTVSPDAQWAKLPEDVTKPHCWIVRSRADGLYNGAPLPIYSEPGAWSPFQGDFDFIGRRGGFYRDSPIYGVLAINRAITDSEMAAVGKLLSDMYEVPA